MGYHKFNMIYQGWSSIPRWESWKKRVYKIPGNGLMNIPHYGNIMQYITNFWPRHTWFCLEKMHGQKWGYHCMNQFNGVSHQQSDLRVGVVKYWTNLHQGVQYPALVLFSRFQGPNAFFVLNDAGHSRFLRLINQPTFRRYPAIRALHAK